jgi:hypothetical protein
MLSSQDPRTDINVLNLRFILHMHRLYLIFRIPPSIQCLAFQLFSMVEQQRWLQKYAFIKNVAMIILKHLNVLLFYIYGPNISFAIS